MNSSLIDDYCRVTKNCDINKLSGVFAYYFGDNISSYISVKSNNDIKIFDIDIKSAFPNICRILFGENDPFVKEIFSIDNKLERNKFISISLTHNKTFKYKISDLNIYSKIIILGYIYTLFDDISILEYKKDGVLFIGKVRPMIEENEIIKLIDNYQIQFSQKSSKRYMRFNRTSIIYYEDKVDIKGMYKTLPIIIKDLILNYETNVNLKQIYSNIYFDILKKSNLKELITNYYLFDTSNYLTIDGSLKSDINQCHPPSYLIYIIYPYLNLLSI